MTIGAPMHVVTVAITTTAEPSKLQVGITGVAFGIFTLDGNI